MSREDAHRRGSRRRHDREESHDGETSLNGVRRNAEASR